MSAELKGGQTIQGRYCVVRLLGKGGFGAVYLVTDIRLGGRQLALKESFDNSAEAQTQFQLEANLLANLSHQSLPRVSDYFIEPTGRQYLVMDFVEGQDLTDMIINAGRPLAEPQALKWITEVTAAVAHLHNQQPHPIIHRDIKPPNIKVTSDGRAVLVDFGIAKVYQPQKQTARIAKAFSPHFSPYEQYVGTTDERSDVYSLGATLYSMVTARLPADAFEERLMKRVQLAPPRAFNGALSPALERVIMTAMEMEPASRYRNAAELLQALRACQAGQPAPAPRPQPPAQANPRCSSCGAPARPGARFCNKCGRPMTPPQPAATPVPLPQASPPAGAGLNVAPEVSFELGNALARNGQLSEALTAYQQALAGGFRDPAVYHNLALVCIMAKRPNDAIAPLHQAINQYPSDPDVLVLLGRALALLDRDAEAIQYLNRAVRLAPQNADAHFWLGVCQLDQKQTQTALAEFEQVVRLQKDSALAYYFIGRCCIDLDNYDRAERVLAEAARLDASDADYHYYLGLARLFGKKPDPALQAFQQALKLDPNYYLAVYYSGRAQIQKDRWQDALQWFQRAASLEPRDPDPHTDMAVCYAMLNRRTDAVASVQRALVIDPRNQRARDLLAKL